MKLSTMSVGKGLIRDEFYFFPFSSHAAAVISIILRNPLHNLLDYAFKSHFGADFCILISLIDRSCVHGT